jgi:transposase-like protein
MEKRRNFTREFKLERVRLIKERGVSYAQASQDPGVHVSQVRNLAGKSVQRACDQSAAPAGANST